MIRHDVLGRKTSGYCATLPPSEAHGMATLSGIVKQLKKERDRVEQQLSGLNAALAAFTGVYRGAARPERRRRRMSAKSRAKIAAAQRARWRKFRAKKKS